MNDDRDGSSSKRRKPVSGDDMPPVQTPTWALATEEDARTVDFEAPIAASKDADTQSLARLYLSAAQAIPEASDECARKRVFGMLEGVMSMHPKIADAYDPFGPMMVMGDRRSAMPSDFRGHVDALAELAQRATNVVLRARISDLCWILDRKRAALANAAVAGYIDIVRGIERGDLVQRFENGDRLLTHHVRDTLKRALQIGRAIGWDKPEILKARQLAIDLRNRALSERSFISLHQFSSLDVEFELSSPQNVAADIERVLATAPLDSDVHNVVALWRLAATAYHYAKMATEKARCQLKAAERLAAEADRPIPAMMAAHFLSDAVAQLSGVPGAKERRNALRHRLIDIQSRVSDEMTTFSQPMDLREIAENVQKKMEGKSLRDKLFLFATLDQSPEPGTLVAEARKSIKEHPLSSLFGTAHMDREGKVVHRTGALDLKSDDDAAAVQQQIAQRESIRRTIDAGGAIPAARQTIVEEHYISEDVLVALLFHSPFVPPELLSTFARAFARFFQGDFVSALYILAPLIENSLRYALKQAGHDVSVFDDSTQTQRDRTISQLYEQMRPELDQIFTPAITTDIDNVFLTRPGPGIRHSVAHGLLRDGDPYGADAVYGCWLIFRICLLPLFPHRDKIQLPFG